MILRTHIFAKLPGKNYRKDGVEANQKINRIVHIRGDKLLGTKIN